LLGKIDPKVRRIIDGEAHAQELLKQRPVFEDQDADGIVKIGLEEIAVKDGDKRVGKSRCLFDQFRVSFVMELEVLGLLAQGKLE